MSLATDFLELHKNINATPEEKVEARTKLKTIKHQEISGKVYRLYIFKDGSALRGNWNFSPKTFVVHKEKYE